MKTKSGISLMILAIGIMVMVTLTGIIVVQIDNAIFQTTKTKFVTEISSIEDRIEENYLLAGVLPVVPGTGYTADEIIAKHTDVTYKNLLRNEIVANGDINNTFLVVDIEKLGADITPRAQDEDTNIYVVATNTLNVYYLQGEEIEDEIRFSLVFLVDENEIENKEKHPATQVSLPNGLNIAKNKNVWTNDIQLTVKSDLQPDETLQYSISNKGAKQVEQDKIININLNTMTTEEIAAFKTNKYVTINKLLNGQIIDTKQVILDNLDITKPSLGSIKMIDTSSSEYNIVKIESTDDGGSGIKCIYYDYSTVLLKSVITLYYTDRNAVGVKELIGVGKITNDGMITLDKHIRSIVAIAVDNAGNASNVKTYTIADKYLISK